MVAWFLSRLEYAHKVDVPNSVTCPTQKPIFEWYVVWCGSKNGHQKDMRLKEIGLRAQNMITFLSSIGNQIGRIYTTT